MPVDRLTGMVLGKADNGDIALAGWRDGVCERKDNGIKVLINIMDGRIG